MLSTSSYGWTKVKIKFWSQCQPANPRSHANFQIFTKIHQKLIVFEAFRCWEYRNGVWIDLLYILVGSYLRKVQFSKRSGWALATSESKAACKFLKILLFSLWDLARKMRLVKRFRLLGSNREKVHWASSCGRFIARKEFWSQCHILLLDTT